MKIGLLAIDSRNFPNLPLMKISAWHKQQGHDVEEFNALMEYDKVYVSKVFDFTPDYAYPIRAKEVVYGGTGYDMTVKLLEQIETVYPHYSLYGIKNTAYGFLTRGCPRQCEFCIVSKKEGCQSVKVADLSNFWKGQREIKLLDPNLLACAERNELLQQLIESKAKIDFTQGLDIRLMTEELTGLIMQCRIKMIHFAWDFEKDSDIIIRKLKEFKHDTWFDYRKAKVYILTNFNTSFEFDLYRVYELKNLGFDPYVMIYDRQNASRKIRQLQRWVNNKTIFRVCEKFEDYNLKLG